MRGKNKLFLVSLVVLLIVLSGCCGNNECEVDKGEADPSSNRYCPGDCGLAMTCEDTDGGINYLVQGTASDDYNGMETDTCYDGQLGPVASCFDGNCTVAEYYCNKHDRVGLDLNYNACPNGCQNGKCVQEETHLECVSQQCVSVSGAGTNQCIDDINCAVGESSYISDKALRSESYIPHEFILELSNGQLANLVNATRNYTYNGSAYSTQMQEKIVVDGDAKFDKTSPVKDLGVFVDSSGFKYVLDLGDGIPAEESPGSGTPFVDGSTDNVVIPFFGENYTVARADSTSSGSIILLNPSETNNYFEGDRIIGLEGTGAFEGQALFLTVKAITASGPEGGYAATFDLNSNSGVLIDTQTVSAGTFLNEVMLSGGEYVLATPVYVSSIGVESGTGRGYVEATRGNNVVRIVSNAQYPYDSSDTNTANDYWFSDLSFSGGKLQSITIKNLIKKWNNSTGFNPLYPGYQSLFPSHTSPLLQKAVFLEGEEGAVGYNFADLDFNGFVYNYPLVDVDIGDTINCGIYSGNTGCVLYKDSGNITRTIPFYVEITGINDTTWQSFKIDNATFWYRCSTTDQYFELSPSNPYLNGGLVTWSADKQQIMTDWGMVPLNANTQGDYLDIFGVAYLVDSVDDNGSLTLLADGNCQFSSTDPNTTVTYVGMGDGIPLNKTIYYNDSNGAEIGRASYPLEFTASVLTDTYKYGTAINETYNKLFLLLDRTTDFTSPNSNWDIRFEGTNLTEDGAVAIKENQTKTAGSGVSYSANNRTHYLPDVSALGGNNANQYYVAVFLVDADAYDNYDLNVNIQTSTGKPIAFPNNQLSGWTDVVSTRTYAWQLTTDTSSQSFLQKAYMDSGTKAEVYSPAVYITGPRGRADVRLAVNSRT